MSDEEDFCGCCGNSIIQDTTALVHLWCEPCSKHISTDSGLATWERTYEAVHDEPCPYQVKYPATLGCAFCFYDPSKAGSGVNDAVTVIGGYAVCEDHMGAAPTEGAISHFINSLRERR